MTAQVEREPVVFLDRNEFAERIGVLPDTLSRYTLPTPDARIGSGPRASKGWLPETIDEWNEARPGRGFWGHAKPRRRLSKEDKARLQEMFEDGELKLSEIAEKLDISLTSVSYWREKMGFVKSAARAE
ncbi:helix-turn-helix DNA-binding domain protein [Gordonia phage Skog]|uniref:Helix-turn-helix DNA-binding domain protein n=1 Tax=Gordonia phage Skog TaxID=2704033 RepID=A0A6G6XKJ9_9CAUD|nr:DNA binding protein [Gordonia phage Skog]QIG58290.1 helix-turn-helix DNA-binding domain protein [Gordonia phage Skog]